MTAVGPSATLQFEDEEFNALSSTGISCDRLRQALKKCIKDSHCVQVQARSAKECINTHDGSVPDKCFSLLQNFSDCKRSLVDMRSRFRGRKGDL
ncbi:Cytochrome Oxidase Assembly subunit [Trichostrongylus colubriformis]|uniref:Cytochrome c oxidase assembly factor 5 n=1 Tax=Trichostrongylus colubriformis TaxID=6319 RepID=A0AAN8FAN3_TRICO